MFVHYYHLWTIKCPTGSQKLPLSSTLKWEIVTWNVCVLTVISHWSSRALCWRVLLQVLELLLNTAQILLLVIQLNRYLILKCILFFFNLSNNLRSHWPLFKSLATATNGDSIYTVSVFHTTFTLCFSRKDVSGNRYQPQIWQKKTKHTILTRGQTALAGWYDGIIRFFVKLLVPRSAFV